MLDELVVLPWPVGLVVGVVGFLLIRHGIPAWFSGQDGLFAQALAKSFPFAPLAWIVLAACAMASLFSFLGARRKRQLLDTRTGLDSIAALGWRDFERLVGEAFRRQGYTVEETGLGGYTPDAARFAQGKPTTLIDGETLLGMIREVQAGNVASPRGRVEPVIGASSSKSRTVPECSPCGMPMVERTNGKTGAMFWGCSDDQKMQRSKIRN